MIKDAISIYVLKLRRKDMKQNTNDKNKLKNDAGLVRTYDAFQELTRIAAANPKFGEAWKDSENEYELIFSVIRLRKELNLSQKEVAIRSKTAQEVISRMENRRNSPSLANFCKIVNSLGYEIKIVKKD